MHISKIYCTFALAKYVPMKKTKYSFLVLFLVLLCENTQAEKILNYYLGPRAGLSEWTLLPENSKYGPSFGVTGDVGGFYELQVGNQATKFLLNVGLDVMGGMTAFTSPKEQYILKDQLDVEGDKFDYIYDVNQRRDQYNSVAVGCQLAFGLRHRRFYFLSGISARAHVFTAAQMTAQVSTYGRYQGLYDDFHNMPKYQFFENWPIRSTAITPLNMDVSAGFEIGGYIGKSADSTSTTAPKLKVEYRLAGFMEYSLTDVHKRGIKQTVETPATYDNTTSPEGNTSMVDQIRMNDIMTTANFSSCTRSFLVGIKFSVLFQLPNKTNK